MQSSFPTGTVEWLPGSPLGNSGYSWSDVLLADMPNVYIYAANNPSESIVAKRRGYAGGSTSVEWHKDRGYLSGWLMERARVAI